MCNFCVYIYHKFVFNVSFFLNIFLFVFYMYIIIRLSKCTFVVILMSEGSFGKQFLTETDYPL